MKIKIKVCPKCEGTSNMIMRSFPDYVDEHICFFNDRATDKLRDADYYIDSPIFSESSSYSPVFLCASCGYRYKGNDVEYIVLDEMVEEDET